MPSGYNIEQHIVSTRLRLEGVGTFHSEIRALEDNPSQVLVDVSLAPSPNRPISQLSNIRAMRLQYYGYIEGENEYFVIKNLTFFTKPISTGYPQ